MRRSTRAPALLVLLGLVLSLVTVVSPGTAIAAESIPQLQWPAVSVGQPANKPLTASPTGSITLPCVSSSVGGLDLTTYNTAGQQIRRLDRNSTIGSVRNCIGFPVVDKNDQLYGRPGDGATIAAFNGNTLKWMYNAACSSFNQAPVVGADGNVYALANTNGVRLIGLTPDVEPGTNQPKKILDIAVPNDCGIMVRPYKDGIVVHGQSSGNARYYSYSGKYLGQAPIGDIWYEKVDAEGLLFVARYVSGSYQSASVDMYDPRTGIVRTTPASTSGANVNGIQLYPLPGGAVAALIREQKMVSDGIPASPTEYIYTLVTINSSGAVTRRSHFSNSYSQNGVTGTFYNTYAQADSTGKVAVMRVLQLNTGLSYPTTALAISIGIYSPASDTWVYQAVMQGDLAKSGGPSGYYFDYGSLEYPVTITSDTLGVVAHCYGNCADQTPRLYPLQVSGLGMDYPRGTVLTASAGPQPAPRSYVALGDSFSSGEGNPPFLDETPCHRSTQAYPRVLGTDPGISLQLDKFVACSGARTIHVLNGWYTDGRNEPPQLGALSGSPKVASITIGGNDIGFVDFAKACVLDTCNFSSGAYANAVNAITNTLPGNLDATYKKLLEVSKPAGTQLYVLGYPQVIADKSVNDPGDARCPYMYESVPVSAGRYWEDARAARDIVSKLNFAIQSRVNAVRALDPDNMRLHFVSATNDTSPFSGHEVCGLGESYFNNVDQALNGLAYVFHPNVLGQTAYAQLIRREIGE